MSILTACQNAAVRLVRRKPTQFFGSTETFELEICELVQDVAVDIGRAADWQKLLVRKEITAVLNQIYYDLPADFDSLPVDAKVHSSQWQTRVYTPVNNVTQWITLQQTLSIGAPGYWMLQGGQIGIFPAMPVGEKAIFYYLTSYVVTDSGGVGKATISADTDLFKLDERLLTLGLVWRYRAQKKLDYAEDLENYNRALSERIGKQKGQRPIALGSARSGADAGVAFPGKVIR